MLQVKRTGKKIVAGISHSYDVKILVNLFFATIIFLVLMEHYKWFHYNLYQGGLF